jgi:hypothetical protein
MFLSISANTFSISMDLSEIKEDKLNYLNSSDSAFAVSSLMISGYFATIFVYLLSICFTMIYYENPVFFGDFHNKWPRRRITWRTCLYQNAYARICIYVHM